MPLGEFSSLVPYPNKEVTHPQYLQYLSTTYLLVFPCSSSFCSFFKNSLYKDKLICHWLWLHIYCIVLKCWTIPLSKTTVLQFKNTLFKLNSCVTQGNVVSARRTERLYDFMHNGDLQNFMWYYILYYWINTDWCINWMDGARQCYFTVVLNLQQCIIFYKLIGIACTNLTSKVTAVRKM